VRLRRDTIAGGLESSAGVRESAPGPLLSRVQYFVTGAQIPTLIAVISCCVELHESMPPVTQGNRNDAGLSGLGATMLIFLTAMCINQTRIYSTDVLAFWTKLSAIPKSGKPTPHAAAAVV